MVKDTLIATHPRCFLRDQLSCDPWHYLAVLEKKPGALRQGLPFQQWDLPESIQLVRNKLQQQRNGDRAFVALLVLAQEVGIDALDMACELALSAGMITVSIVQNELRRLTEPARPNDLPSCERLQLTTEPHADYQRYDYLLGAHHVQ